MPTKYNIGHHRVDLSKVPEEKRQEVLNKLIEISNSLEIIYNEVVHNNGGEITV